MTKYIHIGYPKNLSTTLQRCFFSKHPDIHHLGVGINSNIDYINDELNLCCEDYLIYANNRYYNIKKTFIKESFEKSFEEAFSKKNTKATGISLELLSFKFSPDQIDSEEKANRLLEIFGRKTKIIIIIRNQVDLLQSLYREFIKIGYTKTYREFIEYAYCFKDRNFTLDFCYDKVVEMYADRFGINNIKVLPVENVRDITSGKLKIQNGISLINKQLSTFLNIDLYPLKFTHHNCPLDEKGLYLMMKRNNKFRHGFGQSINNVVNGHRLAKYFNLDLQLPLQEKLNKDVLIKRESIDFVTNNEINRNNSREVDYYFDKYIWKKLLSIYRESNNTLKEKYIHNLPDQYFF